MIMITGVAYFLIWGKPVIMYSGILAMIFLLITATVGFLLFKGKLNWPIKRHGLFAFLTIILVLIHAVLGLSVYFGW